MNEDEPIKDKNLKSEIETYHATLLMSSANCSIKDKNLKSEIETSKNLDSLSIIENDQRQESQE